MTTQSLAGTLMLSACLSAISIPPASGRAAASCPSGDGSDFVFTNGFEMPPPFGFTAFASDVSNDRFIAFNLLDPSIVVPVGEGQGTAFLMDFVGDDFSKAYGIDAFGTMINHLASIDTATGAITPIGVSFANVDSSGWTGFKYDRSTGVAYAVATTCGSSSHLYTIDLDTGAATLVTEIDLPCVYRIAISPAGDMVGLDIDSDTLYSIDKTTGASAPIGSIGFDAGPYQDIDFDDSNGILYYAGINHGAGVSQLRTLDPNALIGPLDSGLIAGFATATSAGTCPPH